MEVGTNPQMSISPAGPPIISPRTRTTVLRTSMVRASRPPTMALVVRSSGAQRRS